jgi:hypothetical protein
MTEASLEQNLTAARHEHLVPGREIHMQDMRGYQFCEDNAVSNIWNTTGACDPTPEQADALDADTIAREHGAQRAWVDPVRRWMFDQLDVWEYDPRYVHRNSTERLDHDLAVSSAHHDNLAHVVRDNLHNIYQGSDVGRAFSQLTPEDGRW